MHLCDQWPQHPLNVGAIPCAGEFTIEDRQGKQSQAPEQLFLKGRLQELLVGRGQEAFPEEADLKGRFEGQEITWWIRKGSVSVSILHPHIALSVHCQCVQPCSPLLASPWLPNSALPVHCQPDMDPLLLLQP